MIGQLEALGGAVSDEEILKHAIEFRFEHHGEPHRLHWSEHYQKWRVYCGAKWTTCDGEWDTRDEAIQHVLDKPAPGEGEESEPE